MKIIENSKLKIENSESGQAMIISVLFFVWVSTATVLGLSAPIVKHISMATSIAVSKESFYVAEAGMEDVVYRLRSGIATAPSQTLTVGNHSVVTTVADISGGKIVTALGRASDYVRKIKTELTLGTGIAFHYGVQAGAGGFVLQNTSSVTGNVHSSGPVVGAGNNIYGDVISAGGAGLINNVHTTGSA